MPRRHVRERGVEHAPLNPGWIGNGLFGATACIDDDTLAMLYRFYVLETPCSSVSYCSRSLEDLGWGRRPWDSKDARLRRRLLNDLGFTTNETLFVGTHTQETAALFRDAALPRSFRRQQHEERIAFYNTCSNQFLSIALHIRHSLAHGRFAAANHDGGTLLYFENGVRSNGRFAVRARLVLSTATLETWRGILLHEL